MWGVKVSGIDVVALYRMFDSMGVAWLVQGIIPQGH